MILTSSDKAANPTSVMGASKLLAEKLVTRGDELPRAAPDDVRERSVRERAGIARLGARAVRAPGRGRRSGHGHRPDDDPVRDDDRSRRRARDRARPAGRAAARCSCSRCRSPRLADLVAATIDVVAPAAGRDPARDRDRRDRAAGRREAVRGADDRRRSRPGPATSARCTPCCRRSRRMPDVVEAYRERPTAPVGAYRSDAVGRWRSTRRRLVAEPGRAEPLGADGGSPVSVLVTGAAGFIGRWVVARPAGARPHRPADRQPRRRRRGEPRRSSRAIRACCRSRSATSATRPPAAAGPARSTRVAHLAASISVQDSIDDPGDDVRERRGRDVQPARGGQGDAAPGSCS